MSAGTADADTSDVLGPLADTTTLAAADVGNDYFPKSIPYTADPSNLFAPVYQIEPIGAADVSSTLGSTVTGTQEFGLDSLGLPVGTFTGEFNYSPLDNPAFVFGNPYGDFVTVTDSSTPLVPNGAGFLVDEFGFGYGITIESSENAANTAINEGGFILTPFGDYNISPLFDFIDSSAFTNLITGMAS